MPEESGIMIGGTRFHPLAWVRGCIYSWYPFSYHQAIHRSSDHETRNVVHLEIFNNGLVYN